MERVVERVVSALAITAAALLVSWVERSVQGYTYPVAHIEALERMEAGEALPPDHHWRPEPAPAPEPPPLAIPRDDVEALQALHRAIIATSPLAPHVDRLQAQMHVESRYDCDAVSPAKAVGCAQFMPATWHGRPAADGRPAVPGVSHDIGCPGVPRTDPLCAMVGQVHYMRQQQRYVRGADMDSTYASYNEGPGNFGERQGACRRIPGCNPLRWRGSLEEVTGLKSPAATDETRRYVRSITAGVKLFEGRPVAELGVALSW